MSPQNPKYFTIKCPYNTLMPLSDQYKWWLDSFQNGKTNWNGSVPKCSMHKYSLVLFRYTSSTKLQLSTNSCMSILTSFQAGDLIVYKILIHFQLLSAHNTVQPRHCALCERLLAFDDENRPCSHHCFVCRTVHNI